MSCDHLWCGRDAVLVVLTEVLEHCCDVETVAISGHASSRRFIVWGLHARVLFLILCVFVF